MIFKTQKLNLSVDVERALTFDDVIVYIVYCLCLGVDLGGSETLGCSWNDQILKF